MVDGKRRCLRYTNAQRNCESGLVAYRKLLDEAKPERVFEVERRLSTSSRKSNDFVEFVEYLKEKVKADGETRAFYYRTRWKFRLY